VKSRGLPQPVLIAVIVFGFLLAGVGGYLMIFSGSKTHVAAGPGGVSVAGTF